VAGLALIAVCAVAAKKSGGACTSVTMRPAEVAYGRMSELPLAYRAAAADADGYTKCWYTIDTYFTHATEILDDSPGAKRVNITIRTARADLGLKSTIWLREQPAAWLVSHEQGHRKIGERCYVDSDQVALEFEQNLLGQEYTGSGSTIANAESDARSKAGRELSQAYIGAMIKYQRLHDIYDELTSHGRSHSISEDSAIDAAFQRFAAEGN
jgi:hypothetical protein